MELTFDNELVRDSIATLVLAVVIIIVRAFLLRVVRAGSDVLNQDQRRWTVGIRNGSWAVLVLGLFFVWAPQLQTLALSITAFAVAVVLATREVIACLVGGLARAGTQPFKIGDWVAIEGTTGEVVDMDAMGVRLQEIDIAGRTYQYTGNLHLVPNVKLLTSSITKLSAQRRLVFHDVTVTVQQDLHSSLDPELLLKHLQEIAETHFSPHREAATAFLEKMRRKTHLDIQGVEPELFLRSTEFSHFVFTARLCLPTAQAARIATEITRAFLAAVRQKREDQASLPAYQPPL